MKATPNIWIPERVGNEGDTKVPDCANELGMTATSKVYGFSDKSLCFQSEGVGFSPRQGRSDLTPAGVGLLCRGPANRENAAWEFPATQMFSVRP